MMFRPTFNALDPECQDPKLLAMVLQALLLKLGYDALLSYSGDELVHIDLEEHE
jgi:hypothetical protein